MKPALTALTAAVLAAGSAAADDTSDVLKTITAMTTAFAAGNMEAIMQSYTPEAVVVGQPGQPVSGDGPLREMFASYIAAGADFDYGAHEVIVAGDTALHLMRWTATAPDGSSQSALSVAVLRRQADGGWKMVVDHPFGNSVMAE